MIHVIKGFVIRDAHNDAYIYVLKPDKYDGAVMTNKIKFDCLLLPADAFPTVKREEEHARPAMMTIAETMNFAEDKAQLWFKGWVARDKDKRLFLYRSEPHKIPIAKVWSSEVDFMLIDRGLFKEVTWENSCKKEVYVNIVLQ